MSRDTDEQTRAALADLHNALVAVVSHYLACRALTKTPVTGFDTVAGALVDEICKLRGEIV